MSPKVYGCRCSTLLQYCNKLKSYSLPEAGCHWLRTSNVAMAMVMVDCMCVQSFVVMHPTII